MKRITDWVHDGLRRQVCAGDWVLDATLGNGHDASLLVDCVGPAGHVFGVDIQQQAVDTTSARLKGASQFHGICGNHARLASLLPEDCRGKLTAAVFNLGYLPGASRGQITAVDSTLAAVNSALDWLAPGGVLSCTCYPGHEEGALEAQAVERWFQ
ncbi:MAG: SAM-dependent methyltransferase, partial [Candidatus Paceibacteria bacterium]